MLIIASNIKKNLRKCYFPILGFCNKFIKKDKTLIFLNCKEKVRWNIIAIFQYLSINKYTTKYKVVCYTNNLEYMKNKYSEYNDIHFTDNIFYGFWCRLKCKYYFSEIVGELFSCKSSRGQISVQLWHGIALKKIGYAKGNEYLVDSFDYMLCYSNYVAEIMKKDWFFDNSKILLSQNPRNDFMFSRRNVFDALNIPAYKKYILWLPTFRSDKGSDRVDSVIQFPLLNEKNINDFDQYLKDIDALLIIKLHPLQQSIPFLNCDYSNIRLLKDSEFDEIPFEFYEIFGQVDALLSDYSSVAIDFMLTNKPIGYVIDDIFDYNNKRGFHVDDPLSLMPGHHIYNISEFKSFLDCIMSGVDLYATERMKVNEVLNEYQDNNNTLRVLNFVGINLA